MEQIKTGTTYTAEEIMAIIDRAADRGVTEIGIPGFKAAFSLPRNNHVSTNFQPQNSQTEHRRDGLGDFVTQFGKYRGRTLSELPRKTIMEYGEYLLKDTGREGLSEVAKEWVDKADQFLRQG